MKPAATSFTAPLIAAALVFGACGNSDDSGQTESLAATADRLADLVAAGDDCEAERVAGELSARARDNEQLTDDGRTQVGDFLAELVDDLDCQPQDQDEPDEVDDEDEERGKGRGKGKGRDKDDD